MSPCWVMMWVQSLRDCVAPGDGGQTHEKISDNGNDQGLGGHRLQGGWGRGVAKAQRRNVERGLS